MKRWVVLLMGIALVLSAGAVAPPTAGQGQPYYYSSFDGLGGHTDIWGENKAFSVSADGTTVVGNNNWGSTNGYEMWGYVWKQGTNMVYLPSFPGEAPGSGGGAANADGTVVGGAGNVGTSVQAGRWTLNGEVWTPEVLGDLPGGDDFSCVWCISYDGNVLAGRATSELGGGASRWTRQVDDSGNPTWLLESLGDLPTGRYNGEARGCSADGSVVVGRSEVSYKKGFTGYRAFRWTSATGMVDLGVIGTRTRSEAWGCSADGSIIVGHTTNDNGSNKVAFRWTAGTGMVSLGCLPGGKISQALGVSPDGSIVVGRGSTRGSGDKAFIWDATNGMRRIDEVLAAHGVSTYGWNVWEASGIATPEPGVIVIVGNGVNPSGFWESWRAVIFH